MASYSVDHDLDQLAGHIRRLGRENASTGEKEVTVKALFDDDAVDNSLESLAGTSKAAKKRGLVAYGPELLLQVGTENF